MRYLGIIALFAFALFSGLPAEEVPKKVPLRAINTDLDEYTPFIIKTGERGIRKGKPWRIYFGRSDLKGNGSTSLMYADLETTEKRNFENDSRPYYLIENLTNVQTFAENMSALTIGDEFGLAASHPATANNTKSIRYYDKLVQVMGVDNQLAFKIKQDFGDTWVSHFSLFPKRYVFFCSIASEMKTDRGIIKSKGSHDIWYYMYIRGRGWVGPYNLDVVNTSADETVPVIDINGEYLFFSSNYKHPGALGGFDIYYTKIEGVKKFVSQADSYYETGLKFDKIYRIEELAKEDPNSTVTAFDMVNSDMDEYGFFRIDLKQAVFCSDKKSVEVENKSDKDRHLDIYHISPIPPYTPPGEIGVLVYDCASKHPLQGVLISLEQEVDGRWIPTGRSQLSDSDGEVYFQKLVAAKYRVYADQVGERSYIPDIIVFEKEADNMYQYFDMPLGNCMPDTVRLTINFCQNCKDLDGEAIRLLSDSLPKIQQVLKHYPKAFIYVNGHTSKEASQEYNCQLSFDRALSVKNWLLGQLGSNYADRFKVVRYGECSPLVNEISANGKRIEELSKINRRVEVVIYKSDYDEIEDDPQKCYSCEEQ